MCEICTKSPMIKCSFWYLYFNFTHFSGVSTVDDEQVSVGKTGGKLVSNRFSEILQAAFLQSCLISCRVRESFWKFWM